MKDALLNKIYFNPKNPGSYGGVKRLQRAVKRSKTRQYNYTRKDLLEFLRGNDSYTLHKNVRVRFPRVKTLATHINQFWELDLSDMQKLKEFNDNYRFILFIIDVFSRHLLMIPLKNKLSKSIADSLENIFNTTHRIPSLITTDEGGEFLGLAFRKLLNAFNIQHVKATNSPHKAAIVERVQRTIKSRLFRYFTAKNTFKYIDVLKQFENSYNNTFHRTINMTPNEKYATKSQEKTSLMDNLQITPFFEIDDVVRISTKARRFKKGYDRNWSIEPFKVTNITRKNGLYLYKLKDLNNESIKGNFYKEELQKINLKSNDELYKIEKIIRTEGTGKNKKLLVKWLGFPDSFNSYIKASDLKKI